MPVARLRGYSPTKAARFDRAGLVWRAPATSRPDKQGGNPHSRPPGRSGFHNAEKQRRMGATACIALGTLRSRPMSARLHFASLRQRLARWLSRPSFFIYLTLGLMAAGLLLGLRLSEAAGMAQLAALANERLELYASTLEAELGRHAHLPSLLAPDEELLAVLRAPDDERARKRASQTLARVNVRAGTMQIFIVHHHS